MIKRVLITGAIGIASLIGFNASPASAASGCATWGCGTATYSGGNWQVTADDTLTDGHCVYVATVSRSTGAIVQTSPQSCGPVVGGTLSGGGSEDAYIVRLFRTGGGYLTLVS